MCGLIWQLTFVLPCTSCFSKFASTYMRTCLPEHVIELCALKKWRLTSQLTFLLSCTPCFSSIYKHGKHNISTSTHKHAVMAYIFSHGFFWAGFMWVGSLWAEFLCTRFFWARFLWAGFTLITGTWKRDRMVVYDRFNSWSYSFTVLCSFPQSPGAIGMPLTQAAVGSQST